MALLNYTTKIGEIQTAKDLGYKTTTKLIWAACEDCGKERWVELRRSKPRCRFCHACAHKGQRAYQWGTRGRETTNWKGGKRMTSAGYIEVLSPEHTKARANGYVFEHILVWEETHRKPLPDGWIVHHINGIKSDNRPHNLLGMSKGKHPGELLLFKVQERLRELELENRQMQRALEDSQMIFYIGGN